ncbi:MAG: LysR family transcriptional regulator [Shimia sp.]
MQIDPRHLEILAAVVDAGGVSEGALALGKSQPSLSRTIAHLEARLGEPLFEKGKRPLRPTELCAQLATEGRRVAQAGAAAARLAARYTQGQSGSVRMGGTPIFLDGVVSTIVAGFQARHPDVRIYQSYGYPATLEEQLTAGTLDLAICPLEASEIAEGFAFTPLLKGRNVIACASGHPLARKSSLRLADISEYPWITQPVGSPLFRDLLASIGVEDFKVSYSGGNLGAIVNVLTGSHALAVLPYSVVFMQPGRVIQALPIRIEHPRRQLGILTRTGARLPPSARRLARHLGVEFASLAQTITERQRRAIWRA